MNKQLLSKLADPEDGSPLVDKGDKLARAGNVEKAYPVESGVPMLYIQNALDLQKNAAQHDSQSSQFHYVDHYIKDGELFDYFEEHTDSAMLHEHRRLHEAIEREIPKDAIHILDVGCGNAWAAQRFCPKGKTVYSFDIAPVNTKAALERYPFDNHFAVSGDVYRLPFQSNTFDAIISAEVIEHVPHLEEYIASLIRVLKPGGTLVLTTPYNEKILYSLCIHCNRPTPQHAHLHSFTEASMEAILKKHPHQSQKIYGFSNKALIFLKTHILLKYFPHQLWRWVDGLTNKIIKKPSRLVAVVTK